MISREVRKATLKRLRNIRQEKFCQAIVNKNIPAVQAYQEAYSQNNYEAAKVKASQLLDKPKIADRITQILNDKGVTIDNLIDCTLKDLLKGEKEVLGTKNKIITLKDNASKAEGLKIALKLHGVMDRDTTSYEDNRQVNITLNNPEDIAKMGEIITRLERLKQDKSFITGEIT